MQEAQRSQKEKEDDDAYMRSRRSQTLEKQKDDDAWWETEGQLQMGDRMAFSGKKQQKGVPAKGDGVGRCEIRP